MEDRVRNLSLELAKRIIGRLTAERLLLSADAEDNLTKLATGQFKAEDWRLAVEKGIEANSEATLARDREAHT